MTASRVTRMTRMNSFCLVLTHCLLCFKYGLLRIFSILFILWWFFFLIRRPFRSTPSTSAVDLFINSVILLSRFILFLFLYRWSLLNLGGILILISFSQSPIFSSLTSLLFPYFLSLIISLLAIGFLISLLSCLVCNVVYNNIPRSCWTIRVGLCYFSIFLPLESDNLRCQSEREQAETK